jgi:hypothetical protein
VTTDHQRSNATAARLTLTDPERRGEAAVVMSSRRGHAANLS